MMRGSMTEKTLIIIICSFVLLFASNTTEDFINGERAFYNGEDKLAEIYFSHFLTGDPFNEHIPDAVYYLIKIYDKRGSFADIVTHANRFLEDFKYDRRGNEILQIVLKYLDDAEAYSLAFQYIKRYDYLIDDHNIIERVGHGLFRQNRLLLADDIFSSCTQTDSVKIMRAQLSTDPHEIKDIYGSIEGGKGKIYLAEFLLETGDTIGAFQTYSRTAHNGLQGALLYRYAKLSKLFNRQELPKISEKLKLLPGFENKCRLLEGQFSREHIIIPGDEEELALLVEQLRQDTVMTRLPDTMNLDSVILDAISEDSLKLLRSTWPGYYFLDSIYCDFLISNKRVTEAYDIIKLYSRYENTKDYTRKVHALESYKAGEYRSAAIDLILANVNRPVYRYILANSLTRIDLDALDIYEDLLHATQDSMFISRVTKELVKIYFPAGKYESVIKLDLQSFDDDTSLVRMYIYSLAQIGKKQKADSLLNQYVMEPDYRYLNHFGEYLIGRKKYKTAAVYYDSLMGIADDHMPDIIYFNWALIPFLQGQEDSALSRFQVFIDELDEIEIYAKTAFKIATIKYLKHEFDSAAFYYGLASKYKDLRLDALQNQLICYKKYGNWSMIIETGNKILPMVSEDEEVEVLFEIGYGFLRSGYARQAVAYLSKAARLKSSPEFYYWLAEAHTAKGEFAQGLYNYLRIIDLFPDDEMWTPTAEYKCGIAFELMDELEEAKKIYRRIIIKRGAQDTWGIEAQKRLEEIE